MLMVRVAHLDRPRALVLGVGVMAVDRAAAVAGGLTEEQANGALLALEPAKGTLVVCGSLHDVSSVTETLDDRPDAVQVQMAVDTYPEQVLSDVMSAL